MAVTPDEFPGTRKEDILELEDKADGDPIVAGQLKYDANRFKLKDNSAVYGPDEVRVSDADTTPKKLNEKITVSGGITKSIENEGNDETLDLASSASAPFNIVINPETLATQGNDPQHIVGDDYAGLELKKAQTLFGAWSTYWTYTTTSSVVVYVPFILMNSGSGTKVRIAIKTKSRATGEDSGPEGTFDDEQVNAVTVNPTNDGNWYETTFSIDGAVFEEGDKVAIHFIRDADQEVTPTTPVDDFNKTVLLGPIRIKVNG